MCNLYTNRTSAAEVAAAFVAIMPTNFNAAYGAIESSGPASN